MLLLSHNKQEFAMKPQDLDHPLAVGFGIGYKSKPSLLLHRASHKCFPKSFC